jgi:hypothetical protein
MPDAQNELHTVRVPIEAALQSVTEPSGSARLVDLISANTLPMPRL